MRRLRGALVAFACLGALSACSDDVNTSADPVEVEVGEAFTWNGFTVDEGWELSGVERSAGAEEVTTPEVKGTITNTSEEERAAIFELVFSADGEPLATISCTAASMTSEQSQQFLCPGLGAVMPESYDAVVVQEFSRDTTSG